MNIPFHRPDIPENFDQIFSDSIRSGWLTTGSQVANFEQELVKYLGAKHVIGLNSCTAALHLALAAKEWGMGYKFIAPTLTFAATVECGAYTDMSPILVDCDSNGFLIDLNQVEDIVKKDKTVKAIIPVHYAGEPVDLELLWQLADKYDLFILEDAAHALEAISNKMKIGNTGFAAAFSFYANKNITTGGEGGALATNNTKLAEKVKKLSLHGITKDGWNRFKTNGKWEYDIMELGYKYNLTDYAASFGLWQLKQVSKWQERRRQIVEYYNKALKDVNGIKLPSINDGHAMHLYVIQLVIEKWDISRNHFIEKMNNRGIGLAVHYKPIHNLSFYKYRYNLDYNDYPIANSIYNRIVTLPLYPSLQNKEIDYITNSILELCEEYVK